MSESTTTIAEQDLNLDTLFNQPGAESILVPEKKDEKPSFFSKDKVDLSFLDKNDDPASKETDIEDPDKNDPEKKEIIDPTKGTAIINELSDEPSSTQEDEEEKAKKNGRPNGLVELTGKLIEKGYIVPFKGEEDISKYTVKDFEELFEANQQEKEKEIYDKVVNNIYSSLPPDFQKALNYVFNGGTDMKNIFKTLAETNEIKELNVDDPKGQEAIVRQYLKYTNFGTDEEIEEQLAEWQDLPGALEKKASQFKPKLEDLKEQEVAETLRRQEEYLNYRRAAAEAYQANVYKALDTDALNGIKLDKKIQNMLYAGLVNPSYPTQNGGQTNLLGHLLEKYQFDPKEARPDLIAEALWLLADPDGYKNKVREIVKKEEVIKTVRQLKTEERNKNQSSSMHEEDDTKSTKTRTIARPSSNFFKRN